jgi:polyhydroxyalkanoate synthesis regulator phasin
MSFENVQLMLEDIFLDKAKRNLKEIEVIILKGTYHGKNYAEIANEYCCTPEYIKHDVAPKLWKLISELTGEKVNKKNFCSVVESISFKSKFSKDDKTHHLELEKEVAVDLEISLHDVFSLMHHVNSRLQSLEQQVHRLQSHFVFPATALSHPVPITSESVEATPS